MIKKIQKYLLLNYPLLWNIKIVPILLCTVIINLIFFFIGCSITNNPFLNNGYYYDNFFSNGIIYFISFITALLVFILWLVFYSKNNAFKVFYPQKASSFYLEWILILVIILSIFSFPLSYNRGSVYKNRSYASKTEMLEAIETLNMIKILIPVNKNEYFLEYPSSIHEMRRMEKNGERDPYINELYIDSISHSNERVIYEDYPNFAQLSLLNYDSRYNDIYIPNNYKFNQGDCNTVKQWLIDNDKQKISSLMDSFFKLVEKHHLKTNLTTEQWLRLVYNPSKYPVGDFNLINDASYEDHSYPREIESQYYLPYNELRYGYNSVMKSYMDDTSETLIYVTICLGILFSLFVLGFRSTSGKSWLIAFISMGLILLINGLFSLFFSGINNSNVPIIFLIVLVGLFVFEFITVLNKNRFRWKKGKSDVFMNHLLAFIPIVPVMIYLIIYSILQSQYNYSDYENNKHSTYKFLNDNAIYFLWGNICLTFITVWFFIKFVLLKWKSLPEE